MDCYWLLLLLVATSVAQRDYRLYPPQVRDVRNAPSSPRQDQTGFGFADFGPKAADFGSSPFGGSQPASFGPGQSQAGSYQPQQLDYRPLPQQSSQQGPGYNYGQPDFSHPQSAYSIPQPEYGQPRPDYPPQRPVYDDRGVDYGQGRGGQPYPPQPQIQQGGPSKNDGFFSNGKGIGSSLFPTLGILNGVGTFGGNSPGSTGSKGFGGEQDLLRSLGPTVTPFDKSRANTSPQSGPAAPQQPAFPRLSYPAQGGNQRPYQENPYSQNPYPENPYPSNPYGPQSGPKPNDLSGRTQPYSPPRPSQTYGPTQLNQPFGPTQSTRPFSPTRSNQPYGPTQSSRPFGPSQSSQPYGPTQNSRPFGPSQSNQPFGPTQSNRPYGPTQNNRQFGPSQSSQPFGSIPNSRPNIPAYSNQSPFGLGPSGNFDGKLQPYGRVNPGPFQNQAPSQHKGQSPPGYQNNDPNLHSNRASNPFPNRAPSPYQNQPPKQNPGSPTFTKPSSNSKSPSLFPFSRNTNLFPANIFGGNIGKDLFSALNAQTKPNPGSKQYPPQAQKPQGYSPLQPPQQPQNYPPQNNGYPQLHKNNPQQNQGPYPPFQGQPQAGSYPPKPTPPQGYPSPSAQPQPAFSRGSYPNPSSAVFPKPPSPNIPGRDYSAPSSSSASKAAPSPVQFPPRPAPGVQTQPKKIPVPLPTAPKPTSAPRVGAGTGTRKFGAGRSPVFPSASSAGPKTRHGGSDSRTQRKDQNQSQHTFSTNKSGGSQESYNNVKNKPPTPSSVPVSFGTSKTSSPKNQSPPPLQAVPAKPETKPPASSVQTTVAPKSSGETTTDRFNFLKPRKPAFADFGLDNLFGFPDKPGSKGRTGSGNLFSHDDFPSFTKTLGKERKGLF